MRQIARAHSGGGATVTQTIGLDLDTLIEISPSEPYGGLGDVTPSGFDMPETVSTSANASGEVEMIFEYSDEEPASPQEIMGAAADGPLTLVRGKHSGKILRLRVPPGPDHTPVAPEVLADRLNRLAADLKRVNQRLNFRLIANILHRFGRE